MFFFFQLCFATVGIIGLYNFCCAPNFMVAIAIIFSFYLSFLMYKLSVKYVFAWIEDTKSIVESDILLKMNRETRRKVLRRLRVMDKSDKK